MISGGGFCGWNFVSWWFFPSKSQLKGGSGERERSVGSDWSCWGGSWRVGSQWMAPVQPDPLGDVPTITHGLWKPLNHPLGADPPSWMDFGAIFCNRPPWCLWRYSQSQKKFYTDFQGWGKWLPIWHLEDISSLNAFVCLNLLIFCGFYHTGSKS